VLADLLQKYGSTEYGASHNAAQVTDIADYRGYFPIINYSALIPFLKQVKERTYKAVLPEPSETWVMTSGSNWALQSPPSNSNSPQAALQLWSKRTH